MKTREEKRRYHRDYYNRNRERRLRQRKEYLKNSEYKEKQLSLAKEWRRRNKDKMKEYNFRNRSKIAKYRKDYLKRNKKERHNARIIMKP